MISVRKLNANNVAKVSAKNIWTGNYIYKDSSLKLGDLNGNRFRIVLRYNIFIYIFLCPKFSI